MATQITTLTAGYILIQAGHGIPNHAAPKGSQFTDVDTATLYFNKNGLSDWEVNIDVSNSGSTIGINTFSSFSSSTVGQGSVIATTSSDNLTFSGINLSILVDNTNKILTLSAATSSNGTTFTGGTVNGFTNFTNGLSATTISATTFYGNGSNLTGLSTQDTYLTGGTYSNGTATFTNNTGGTFTVSGFKTSEVFVTGGTYSNSTGVTTFTNNTGGTFTVSGYFKPTDDIYTTGMTFNASNYNLSITRNDGTSFTQNLAILASDMTITGGTYSSSTGIATFTNNTGGTFSVSGFLTGMTDTYTTGFTYSNNTLTLKRNASQPDLSVMINSMTGLTVNGTISTTTISATTYQNLPTSTDITVTGGTYSSGTATFTNNTGGTFTVTGFKTSDLVVTGGTYNSGSILFTNNTGGTFSVSGLYTGYTAPVDVTVTGGTYDTNSGIATFTNNTGGTFTLTGFKTSDLVVTGGTYSNGNATFTNNTGGTFTVSGFKTSDLVVTGGTYSNGSILFTNNTGGTFNVTGLYTGYTAPIDVYTTGATYSNNTFIHTNNTGGTYSVLFDTVTGLTVNGNLNVTGLTTTNGITSTSGIIFKQVTINSSYTATTNDYMIDVTDGTFTVTLPSAVGIQGRLLVVKNNGGGAVTVQPILGQNIDGKPFVILGETNSLQLASNGSNWIALGYNISTVNSSTGVFEFTGLTKVSSNTFNVGEVKGWIVDDTTNPLSPQLYYIYYSGGVHTDNYVTTANETFVYLTSGGTISQQSTPLTASQRRLNIFLGKLGHPDKTTINLVFSQPDFVLSPLSQLRDMFIPINLINGGVYPSANTGLTINTSAGYIYGLGINFASDTLNPNSLYIPSTNPLTFQYRTQTGGTITNVTNIDPVNYDLNGVITPLSGTKATNQRIYLLQNGTFRVQYGQTQYSNFADAVQGLQTETFTEFPNFVNNAVLIGILTLLSSATDLTDTSKAKFFFASKFGETVGAAGGVSTTTLQQAYNNSVNPEITTNSIEGALSIKNGTGNADNVTRLLEGQTGTNGVTSFIRADGYISGTTFQSNGFIANNNGVTATTVSATTYYNLPTDITVTGGTYNAGTATFTNNTGGTFSVTGFNTGSSSGLTASDYVVQGYLAASQTITSNLDTILQFSDDYDPQNWWDASSYRFTPTIAGYYQITLQVLIQAGTVTNNQYNTQIRKNGSNQEAIWQNQITTSTGVSQANSKTIYMNGTTDYIDFTVYQGDPGSVDVFGSSQKSQTFFHAHLLTGLNSSSFTASNLGAGTGIFAQKSGVDFQFKSLTSTGGTVTLTNNATTVNLEVVPASNFTGGTVNGATNFTNGLTSNTFSATTYFNLPTDVRVTGGTYSSGTATFTNNTGGTFTVTGFNTGTSSTDTYVTGSTYSNNTFTFTNNTGGTFNVLFNTVTGLTSTGTISSSILSATTYLNLPTDIRVTGGTYSSGTATFTNNTGGTFNVSGFLTGNYLPLSGGTVTGATNFTGGLVANTISATTYQNLPTDIRVTGGTYSSGTATFTNNTGGTFTVTGFSTGGSATFNGGTVTGATYFTGGVSANTLTASGTGQNILTVIGSGNSTTSPIFSVVGSQGELFSVSDSLTGSLFSVNDISGLPIVEVFSDNTVLMGSYQAPSLNTTKKLSLTAGTNTVYSIPTSTYTGAFIDYTVISSGSTGARAGTIMSIWSGTTAQYTDVSTNDIGTTAGITFSVSVVGSNAVLSTSATTAGWTLKTIIRSI